MEDNRIQVLTYIFLILFGLLVIFTITSLFNRKKSTPLWFKKLSKIILWIFSIIIFLVIFGYLVQTDKMAFPYSPILIVYLAILLFFAFRKNKKNLKSEIEERSEKKYWKSFQGYILINSITYIFILINNYKLDWFDLQGFPFMVIISLLPLLIFYKKSNYKASRSLFLIYYIVSLLILGPFFALYIVGLLLP